MTDCLVCVKKHSWKCPQCSAVCFECVKCLRVVSCGCEFRFTNTTSRWL